MDYSIIIPVFNKAELTRNCLRTLPPTLEGAGAGEVIVIDNASSDETPEMLAEFPWARVVRNERNLGFAGANNQGARMASGRYLVLLNNDTQAFPGWLAAMLRTASEPSVGAVGARLLYPNDTIQHAGVVVAGHFFGRAGFSPFHVSVGARADDPNVLVRSDFQIVTGACLLTPRELYLELGGLDEIYWNGYEDVDYCLKLGERGLRVVYEPDAKLYHFESQSGAQRFRRVWWNVRTLADRWRDKVRYDSLQRSVAVGRVAMIERYGGAESISLVASATPPTTIYVHGPHDAADRPAVDAMLRRNRSPIAEIVWDPASSPAAARETMAVRGERFIAFVDVRARLEPGWLDELVAQTVSTITAGAATAAPELPEGENVVTLATDARCTLLFLKQFPQHLELRDADTLGGAVADLLLRAIPYNRGTRGARRRIGTLPPLEPDAWFARERGAPLASVFDTDPRSVERELRGWERPSRGLVSIVTLSWNAPDFTRKALDSIAARTSEPYEVIVVDNGSDGPTRTMLAAIDDPHVRVVYNPFNRGYAGGNNDGIAVARGDYVVLLNNDVIVTDGWLDGLLDPFRRAPGTGVTAPRSNKVVGHQQLPIVTYDSEAALMAFAAARREAHERGGYFADRAIGLCLCIDRLVLEQVGGLDERFGLGNFEDDDFCIRVRAAGYGIYVCNDVFIHHFGSQSFVANKVDYTKTMAENWSKFAAKWNYPQTFPKDGYNPRAAFAQGFDRRRHYVPVALNAPSAEPAAAEGPDDDLLHRASVVFHAVVRTEAQWTEVAEFARRFAKAFKREDRALLAIGAFDEFDAAALAVRMERIFKRAGVDPESAADVEISDEDDEAAWRGRFEGTGARELAAIEDRSPSALRRMAVRP